MIRRELPPDFRDRPWWVRTWIDLQVLVGYRKVKAVCCESFRKEEKRIACKGCASLYHCESANPWRRFLGRIARRRI